MAVHILIHTSVSILLLKAHKKRAIFVAETNNAIEFSYNNDLCEIFPTKL